MHISVISASLQARRINYSLLSCLRWLRLRAAVPVARFGFGLVPCGAERAAVRTEVFRDTDHHLGNQALGGEGTCLYLCFPGDNDSFLAGSRFVSTGTAGHRTHSCQLHIRATHGTTRCCGQHFFPEMAQCYVLSPRCCFRGSSTHTTAPHKNATRSVPRSRGWYP